jgi:gliding motility-associated-like protein
MKTVKMIYTALSLISNKTSILCFKKPKALLLAFAFFNLVSYSQVNYVLNPSFEQVDSCPVYVNYIRALNWDTLMNGGGCQPDVMTPCYADPAAAFILGVPLNIYGRSYQWPRTGKNYHNFCLFRPLDPVIQKEYLQGTFNQKLKNKSYCITYYLNLSNNSRYAIDNIGVVIDDGSIHTGPCQATIAATSVSSPVGAYISDTLNWIKVQGLFSAQGNETKITIGSFDLTANTKSISVGDATFDPYSYYFIDDVSVIEADLPANAGRDTVICSGDSVFIGRPPEIGLECLWSTGASTIGTGGGLWVKPATTQTFMVSQDVCGIIKDDTIKVQVKPKYTGAQINLSLSSSTTCPGNTIVLTYSNNPPGTNSYNWQPLGVYTQTTSATASAVVSQSTTFSLEVSNSGQNAFCPFNRTASVTVAVPVYTDSPSLSFNSIICPEDTINFSIQNAAPGNTVSYQWLPSAAFTNTYNLSAKSLISQSTTYTINVSSSGNTSLCAFTRTLNASVFVPDSCFKDPQIPNIFTPNGDNVNDAWEIKFPNGYSLQELIVYDRWGTLIYEQDNLNFEKQGYSRIGWDGYTNSGNQCTAGVYFYVLKYTDRKGEIKNVKGNVTLMK